MTMTPTAGSPHSRLVELAQMFVGVTESGPNSGPLIELFQKSVGGIADRQPYCCAFVQYCCKEVDSETREEFPGWPGTVLYPTELCMTMWNMTPRTARLKAPEPGAIAIWQHWREVLDNKGKLLTQMPLISGHTGIVINVVGKDVVETVEANTSQPLNDSQVVREGEGVYLKRRVLRSDIGTMRFVGFLDPWSCAPKP